MSETFKDMEDTVFHRIIRRELPADILFEDEDVVAFRDIHPVAPVHILIIPKRAITSLVTIREEDKMLLGHILWVAHLLAEQERVAETGYRVVTNSGEDSRREVEYLHFHLIGGKRLGSKIG